MSIKVSLKDAVRINKSDKDFVVFKLDSTSKIVSYKLTDDLHRHYKPGLNNFRLVDVIKKEIEIITI